MDGRANARIGGSALGMRDADVGGILYVHIFLF